MSTFKKILNIFFILLGVILILAGCTVYKLKDPRFQTTLAQKAVAYLSKKLNTEITLGSIEIGFFHSMVVRDILIKDRKNDTLLSAGEINARFRLLGLLRNKFEIDYITLTKTNLYLRRSLSDSDFNFQFILDALSSKNPSSEDTSAIQLRLSNLDMNQTHFILFDAPNATELNFLLPKININVNKLDLEQPKFDLKKLLIDQSDLKIVKLKEANPDTSTVSLENDTMIVHINTKTIQLFISDFEISNSKFTYDDENEPYATEGFDGVHESFSDLNLHFTNASMVLDTIKAHVENLSAKEKCGFVLNHLEGDGKVTTTEASATNLKIETPNSSIKNFFSMQYTNFHGFLSFNEGVRLNANLEHSKVSMKDIRYFISSLPETDEQLLADGKIRGPIDNLKGKDLDLRTGNITQFRGDIDLRGLPDIDETFIELNIDNFYSNAADIKRWIPGVKLPNEVVRLGAVNFTGNFSGFTHDFVAYGQFNTQLGKVTSDLNLKFKEKGNKNTASYSGNLAAAGFDIGHMLAQDSLLGKISFSASVKGVGLNTENETAGMTGSVQQIEFNGYNYENADVDGKLEGKVFTGNVHLNDKNIRLSFAGLVDWNKELPVYNFKAKIDSANLRVLNLVHDPYVMSASVDINMSGKKFDDMIGYARASKINISRPEKSWMADSVLFRIDKENNYKTMLLKFPQASASFEGTFALTKLPASVMSVLNHYFSQLPGESNPDTLLQDFDFEIKINRVSSALAFFFTDWRGMDSTHIKGHFSSVKNEIDFTGTVPTLDYGPLDFDHGYISAHTHNDSLTVLAGSQMLTIDDSITVNTPGLAATVFHDVAIITAKGISPDFKTHVDVTTRLSGDTSGIQLQVLPSELVLNGRKWSISENNLLTYTPDRLIFENFELTSEERRLVVKNVNLRVKATNLGFDFNNIPIEDFHELLQTGSLDFGGNITGTAQVLNIFNAPRIDANVTITDFVLNGSKVKQVNAVVAYLPEEDRLSLQSQFSDPEYDMQASGDYYPRKTTDQLKLEVNVKKAELGLLQHLFFEGMISNTHGSAEGKLFVEGTVAMPALTGNITVNSLTTTVNYLQTTYRTYHTPVKFTESSIDFGSFKLYDEFGDSADVKGHITHDHLHDFVMNVGITSKRFLALNTTSKDDSVFYGTARIAGIIQFLGPVDGMEIRASAKTLKGTNIAIPVYSTYTSGGHSFIQYYNPRDTSVTLSTFSVLPEGLTMDFNLEITPDAVMQIIFNEKTGDIIRGSGDGNLRIEINDKGDFNMYGLITIEKGDYLFAQFNFFNKYFNIQKGGSIVWNGDPYEAQINISAIYSTKASLYDLVAGSGASFTDDEMKELKQRTNVDLYLKLNGNLFSPDISFDIRLPDVSAGANVANIELARMKSDENEMNKQVFGILVLGHFLPPEQGLGNESLSSEVNNTLSEFLFNQISYLASSIRDDVDISVNYQSYTTETNINLNPSDPTDLYSQKRNELQVALTKRFFNDRLAVDVGGNFDFGGSSTTPEQSTTGIAGDFAVEYKITPDGSVSGKVFSYSDYDVIDERNKTKNGVALTYTREFDNLKEFFKDPDKERKKQLRKELKRQMEEIPPPNVTPVTPPDSTAK